MIPKKFFVATGSGLSLISELNAFDRALVKARVDQCNLVPVSSILPKDIVPVEYEYIPPGTITHCVLSRADGTAGQSIGAGIGYAFCEGIEIKQGFGIIAEDYGNKTKESIEETVRQKLHEMAEARVMRVKELKVEVETIDEVPEDTYGSVVAILVFVPEH